MDVIERNFNPNGKKYRLCCCHVKTCTVIFGILEIFLICFVLVAVLPDLSIKLCDTTTANNDKFYMINHDDSNDTQRVERIVQRIYTGVCTVKFLWITWSIVQIIATILMLYGLKNTKWMFFLPHIILRVLLLVVITALLLIPTVSAICCVQYEGKRNHAILLAVLAIITILFIPILTYVIICQLRCCEFIKRSAETGFSISATRPLGPSSMSTAEARAATTLPSAPPPSTALKQLPPLKHIPKRKTTPVPVYADLLKVDPLARPE